MESIIKLKWYASVGGSIQHTDQPRLGSGNYNGIEGWYFTKVQVKLTILIK